MVKIRTSFVSNSSSSSFIVGFQEVPKTRDELKKLIGWSLDEIKTSDEQYSVDFQIDTIWESMQSGEATPIEILDELYTIADHKLMEVRDWLDEDRRRIEAVCFLNGPDLKIYPDWIIKASDQKRETWIGTDNETSKQFGKRLQKNREAVTTVQWYIIDQFKKAFRDYPHRYIFNYGESELESGQQFGWLPRWYISHH